MKLYKIKFNSNENRTRTKLFHLLFGRIRSCRVKGNMYYHYYRGALDDVKYKYLGKAKVMIDTELPDYVIAEVKLLLPSFKIELVEGELDDTFKTSRERWIQNVNYEKCTNITKKLKTEVSTIG